MKALILLVALVACLVTLAAPVHAVPSEIAGGTQTATIGTEHILTTQTAARNYVLVVDTVNMVNGDVLELLIKTRARAGEALRIAYMGVYTGSQAEPIKYSVPVPANIEFQATLKQTQGTAKSYVWAVLSLD